MQTSHATSELHDSLTTSVRRSLVDRREILEIAGVMLRFHRAGEHFEHAGRKMLAIGTGAYTLSSTDSSWMYEGSGSIESLIERHLRRLTSAARDELATRFTAEAMLSAVAISQPAAPSASTPAPSERPRPVMAQA